MKLTEAGYALLPSALDAEEVTRARSSLESRLQSTSVKHLVLARGEVTYAARELLQIWPESLSLLSSGQLPSVLHQHLGEDPGVVRAQLFDKPPRGNWSVPWHRDKTVAIETEALVLPVGFAHPTVKRGVPHVEAPAEICRRMLAVRIHLEDSAAASGALRVIPGSHTGDDSRPAVTVEAKAGDVLVMRPWLLHSSRASTDPNRRRRVLHFELAPRTLLPRPLQWHRFAPLPRRDRS